MSTDFQRERNAFLDGVRAVDNPTEDDKSRVRAALLVAIATNGQAATSTQGASVGSAGATSAFAGAKVGIAAFVLLSGAVGFYLVSRPPVSAPSRVERPATTASAHAATAIPAVQQAVSAPAIAAPVSEEASASSNAPRAMRARRVVNENSVTQVLPRPTAEASDLNREMQLLRDAQVALRDGNVTRAQELLVEHATNFPAGILANERRVLQQRALDARGHDSNTTAPKAGHEEGSSTSS